jgi:hypothetical protein
MDSKELNKKKIEDYDKFLNITNRKAAIFRDIIIESECKEMCNPFTLVFTFFLSSFC